MNHWTVITDATSAVQFIMAFAMPLMGLSHILQPKMWRDYFQRLHAKGAAGVVTRTFSLELWPALIIVAFHQVWTWPGFLLTVYGWLLLTKCVISLLSPRMGVKSLAMTEKHDDRGFVIAGIMLIAIGASAAYTLLNS